MSKHDGRQREAQSSGLIWLLMLGFFGVAIFLVARQVPYLGELELPKAFTPAQPIAPEVAAPTPEPVAPDAIEKQQVQQVPKGAKSSERLRFCMQGKPNIDESVLRCAYGNQALQSPEQNAPAQGMVSAEYLARYQRDKAQELAQQAQPRKPVQVLKTGKWVEKWSGGARYYAAWNVIDNRIEGGSVCENHRRGSIDYRECRKGAKQFFKEHCRALEKRWQSNRSDELETLKDRYCSAANVFSPL